MFKKIKLLTKNMSSNYLLLFMCVFLCGTVDYAVSDYENTWNFYYEQPCCGNTNGQHHLRHHRGKHLVEFLQITFYFWYYWYKTNFNFHMLVI